MLALVVQQAPRAGPHILVQVVGWRHSRARGGVVRVTKTPATTAQVMVVMMIVVLKEFIFAGRKIIQGLLLEGSPWSLAPVQESPSFRPRMQHPRHQAE